ncbi:MAG: hypothetical protein AMXMBFR84_16190 [Candidatus Hydrogenedentota bacterium]
MSEDKPEQNEIVDSTVVLNISDLPLSIRRGTASLIILTGWEIGRKMELSLKEQVIGRALQSTICIPVPSVSRSHAMIVRSEMEEGPLFEVVDMQSSNGVLVNNERVARQRLQDGDKIKLGNVVLKFVVEDDIDEAFHKEIHRRIHYDDLTGLLTLGSLKQQLQRKFEQGDTFKPLTVAMTDLDGLKRVNDTYGHLAGAMIVREMGAMIRKILRPQDFGGLYGGDETILFYPNTSIEEAAQIAETIRQTIAARVFKHGENEFKVSISQGLSEWPLHGQTMDQIIAAADGALYAAKAAGRNCIRFAEG